MFEQLKDIKLLDVFLDEDMAKHTTFKCGGKAACLCVPYSVEALKNVISFCKDKSINYFVMGNGSNLLVKDEGFDGIIIKLAGVMKSITCEDDVIICEAGALLSTLSKFAAKHNLTGLEFAEGIPGTVGGAVYMNAGAYDGEIKDIILASNCLTPDGDIVTIEASQHELGYRSSIFQKNGYIVLASVFQLKKGNSEEIDEKMKDFSNRRKTKQPIEMPSAGSTFKRPEGYFAGKLIEDCGLRGYSIGGAQVSEKHCGFIVNKGNATATDVVQLIDYVKEQVKQKFDVNIFEEIKII